MDLRFTSVRAIPTSPGRRAPFFPPNGPTKALRAEETLNPEGWGFRMKNGGRRGEAEIENGPGDHFPAEPTDEAIYREETLNPGFKDPLRLNTKMDRLHADPFCIYAEEGT